MVAIIESQAAPSSAPTERFLLRDRYFTNLPVADRTVRVSVELLVEPESGTFWATVPDYGVAAAGNTPAEAAVAAMRAAMALA